MRPQPEKPAPGQESVWDYPRPPRLEPTPLRLTVEFAGVLIADTTRGLRLLETSHPPTYYFPPSDVRLELLTESGRTSFCEYKGSARYYSLRVHEKTAPNVAWFYPDPTTEFRELKGFVAFYCAPLDRCRVGEWIATPQPGGFYGGWVTPNLAGPFKGSPGTMGW